MAACPAGPVGGADAEFRAGRLDDLEALLAIQRASSLVAFADVFPPGQYPFPDEPIREHLRGLLSASDRRVVVAARLDRPVGFVGFGRNRLDSLFVLPEEWGSGLAGILHDRALYGVRELGGRHLELWVLEANGRARRFYERRGWRLDGRHRRSLFRPYPPLVGYRLDLGSD